MAYAASNNLTNLVMGTTNRYYIVLDPEYNVTNFLKYFSNNVETIPSYS